MTLAAGEFFTKLTVWIAVCGYCIGIAAMLARGQSPARLTLARVAWTVGCIFLLLHVAAAFHFYHNWSHAAAVDQTAAETNAVVGINWGGGIWFNYLLLVVWIADVVWWWVAPDSHRRRPGWVTIALHGYFAFIVFNAVVIFEKGLLRWMGLAITIFLLLWAARERRKSKNLVPRG